MKKSDIFGFFAACSLAIYPTILDSQTKSINEARTAVKGKVSPQVLKTHFQISEWNVSKNHRVLDSLKTLNKAPSAYNAILRRP